MTYYNLNGKKLYTKEQVLKIEKESFKETYTLNDYLYNLDKNELLDIIKESNFKSQFMKKIEKDYEVFCEEAAQNNFYIWDEYEVDESN